MNFDVRMAPRNHAELKKLVEAVRSASMADETFWLEWKSDLDLNPEEKSDKSGRAHIARAIIGFANRIPDRVSGFVEGYGFLLAGVSPEDMNGVEQHDITELVRWIQPYVGDVIRWQPTYVEAEGENGIVSILVITVDPPRWGDPIHCMRKQAPSPQPGKSIPEAAIFVRRTNGTTDRATAADIDALGERLTRRTPSLNLNLKILSGAATPVTCPEDEVSSWLGILEKEALESLREHQQRTKRSLMFKASAIYVDPFEIPEERSPEQYKEDVKDYLAECRAKLPEAINETAAAILEPVVLRLTNLTDTPLLSVQVVLHIPGDVRALEPEEALHVENEAFLQALPSQPRYGPTRSPLLGALSQGYAGIRHVQAGPSIEIDNSGSALIHLSPVDLRPGRYVDLDPFVLVTGADSGESITAEWTATSINMDGSVTGQMPIPCRDRQSFLRLFAAIPSSD
ncbi:hypothetical protein [Nonomuraea sp. NPDC050643]|uniref:hypothetical protein n=1 Tax=Nonomuraea sp. NPDC050643 TaxID=3155660 RepID=UPI0033E77E2B